MTFTVPEGILDNVLARVSDGNDPLGIGTGMPRTHSGDRAEEVVNTALCGLTPNQASAVEQALRKHPLQDPARLDLVTVDLLVHRGVDPLAVAWLASVDDGLSVHDHEDLSIVIEFNGKPYGAVSDINNDVWWYASCAMAIKGLPDTVVTATNDRRLRDIVSHPVLDRHPLVVRNVQLAEEGDYARLVCQREAWMLDGSSKGHPRLMPDTAEIHHLADGHRKLVSA